MHADAMPVTAPLTSQLAGVHARTHTCTPTPDCALACTHIHKCKTHHAEKEAGAVLKVLSLNGANAGRQSVSLFAGGSYDV